MPKSGLPFSAEPEKLTCFSYCSQPETHEYGDFDNFGLVLRTLMKLGTAIELVEGYPGKKKAVESDHPFGV